MGVVWAVCICGLGVVWVLLGAAAVLFSGVVGVGCVLLKVVVCAYV